MVVIIAGAVLATLLLVAFAIDKHDHRHGHASRSSADRSRIAREARQDARVIDHSPSMMGDASWTEFNRRGRRRRSHHE
jgi:hypothetical protein